MASVGVMVKQLEALLGTDDLTEWEAGFVENVARKTGNGQATTTLTEKQVETIERIWRRHFA